MPDNDKVLESFLETAKLKKLDLPDKFLKKIYNIEKKYRYRDDNDRGIAFKEIKNAIEEYIANTQKTESSWNFIN